MSSLPTVPTRSPCSPAWQSGNSWANMGQQCRFCDVMVYPFRRTPPEKPEDAKIDLNRPHPEELCEKCQALGYSCRSHRDY